MASTSRVARRLLVIFAAAIVTSMAITSNGSLRPAPGPAARLRANLALVRTTAATPSAGSISGTVHNGDGSVPLQGICVVVDMGNGGSLESAATAADGTYTLSGLAPGPYVIRFDNHGDCGSTPNPGSWVTQWYDDATSFGAATPVNVVAGANTPGIDADMLAGGRITGTVTGNSVALQNICVVIDTGPSFGPPPPAPAATSTASDGTYSLSNLATGQSYVIRFDNNNDCAGAQPNPGSWLTQWYNDASSFATANPVSVPSTTPVTGINAVMAQGASISGKVVNADTGAALSGICVTANFNSSFGGPFVQGTFTQTSATGTYLLKNLISGGYTVTFDDCQGQAGSWVQQWWESAASQSTASPMNVTAPATASNIDAALVPGGSISGTVTGNSSPLQGICVVVDSGQTNFAQSQLSASTNSSGKYTLRGLPTGQSYVLRFDNNTDCPGSFSSGSWVTQWYKGASSFSAATKVSVSTTTPVTGINATMVQGGSISGVVTGNSAPQSGICVSIDPGLPTGSVTQQTQTGGDGTYTLNNVAAGSYKIRFDSYSCSFNGSAGPGSPSGRTTYPRGAPPTRSR